MCLKYSWHESTGHVRFNMLICNDKKTNTKIIFLASFNQIHDSWYFISLKTLICSKFLHWINIINYGTQERQYTPIRNIHFPKVLNRQDSSQILLIEIKYFCFNRSKNFFYRYTRNIITCNICPWVFGWNSYFLKLFILNLIYHFFVFHNFRVEFYTTTQNSVVGRGNLSIVCMFIF